VPFVLVALALMAWALDERAHDGRVPRNTEVAGLGIGGLDRDGLEPVMDRLTRRYERGQVVVRTADGDLRVAGADLGLTFVEGATIERALAEGADVPLVRRPLEWVGSLLSPRQVPVTVRADPTRAAEVVAERDPTGRQLPVEPAVEGRDGSVVVVPGEQGRGLDGATVARAVPAAAADGDLPVVVEAEPEPIAPRFDDQVAQELADEAMERTAAPLPLVAGGTRAVVPVEVQREWFSSTATDEGIELVVDPGQAHGDVEELLSGAGTAPVNAVFVVEGEAVVVVPGRDGSACCAEGAGDLVVDALGAATPVELPLRPVRPQRTTAEAQALGIVEPIGTFTTSYTAGQSRNQNIQRMADLVRGAVIEPGGRLSVNGHVGERTREKGFTDGGEIRDGVLTTAVGGGVSQFATTAFNAAFFAGLPIPEYQMHSLYFSRYPYGREATLSFPQPDLVIANDLPHGVLVWTSHTDTSVTVTLYGTPAWAVEQTGQVESRLGACTRVTTERTRTPVGGGEPRVDTFSAAYRPREGVTCG
jgi:vancomycin resistance protein YoaR